MNTSFRAADGSAIQIPTETARELLAAMGRSRFSPSGSMPLVAAINGLHQAKMAVKTLSTQAQAYLSQLDELVKELVTEHFEVMSWF